MNKVLLLILILSPFLTFGQNRSDSISIKISASNLSEDASLASSKKEGFYKLDRFEYEVEFL